MASPPFVGLVDIILVLGTLRHFASRFIYTVERVKTVLSFFFKIKINIAKNEPDIRLKLQTIPVKSIEKKPLSWTAIGGQIKIKSPLKNFLINFFTFILFKIFIKYF